jgi:hypothetical protein
MELVAEREDEADGGRDCIPLLQENREGPPLLGIGLWFRTARAPILRLGEVLNDTCPFVPGCKRGLAGRIISLIHRRLRTQAALVAFHLCLRKNQLYSNPSYWT